MLPIGPLRQVYDPNGWTQFTEDEQITMMTLWSIFRSPLMIGGEMTKNDVFTLDLLTNAPLLEIQKTTWCAHPLYTTDEASAWVAPRKDGKGLYVALFNLSDKKRKLSLDAAEAELNGIKSATELWSGKKGKKLSATLNAHDAAVWFVEEA